MAWFFSRRKPSQPERRCRPTLEALEDRLVPAYSSLPGAPATLYLDFDGDFESQWASSTNITTPAFDTDGNPGSFSASELTAIHDVWAYVAEDYAPFNINVTTADPGSYPDGVALKVVVGGDGLWTGGTFGGISYVGAFTNSTPNVSFVFPPNLANTTRYIADAAAHEAGHAFGLDHQSEYAGETLVTAYSSGPGDDTAPLMGLSYVATRSLWWYGTSRESPTTFQNDMEVIASSANGFGYRADDHGDTAEAPTALTVSSSGAFSASGVIEKMTDLDYTIAEGEAT
jgi:hypothetical protein